MYIAVIVLFLILLTKKYTYSDIEAGNVHSNQEENGLETSPILEVENIPNNQEEIDQETSSFSEVENILSNQEEDDQETSSFSEVEFIPSNQEETASVSEVENIPSNQEGNGEKTSTVSEAENIPSNQEETASVSEAEYVPINQEQSEQRTAFASEAENIPSNIGRHDQQTSAAPSGRQQEFLIEPNVSLLASALKDPLTRSALKLDNSEGVGNSDQENNKKKFRRRKKNSERNKQKCVQQNLSLRKKLIPKNALASLNEMRGVSISDLVFKEKKSGGFTAYATINNRQYQGDGKSKAAAKNNAGEEALREIIMDKLLKYPLIPKAQISNPESNVSIDTCDEGVPMFNLAAFAIYKLFSNWESNGYAISELHPNYIPNKQKKPLQLNWKSMHPGSFLSAMRPGTAFIKCGRIGAEPQQMCQAFEVIVDGHHFVATGRNIKMARRNVAAMACNTLFDTSYEINRNPPTAAN